MCICPHGGTQAFLDSLTVTSPSGLSSPWVNPSPPPWGWIPKAWASAPSPTQCDGPQCVSHFPPLEMPIWAGSVWGMFSILFQSTCHYTSLKSCRVHSSLACRVPKMYETLPSCNCLLGGVPIPNCFVFHFIIIFAYLILGRLVAFWSLGTLPVSEDILWSFSTGKWVLDAYVVVVVVRDLLVLFLHHLEGLQTSIPLIHDPESLCNEPNFCTLINMTGILSNDATIPNNHDFD